MSTKQFKEFISSVFSPVSHLGRKFRRFLKRISRAVRRELLLINKRAKRAGAGFVLPTVTMVMLVVVLLTLSIAFRSFERVNQARNVRINQALLSASTPALDRARAKISYLLNSDPATNVGGTPTEKALMSSFTRKSTNSSGTSDYLYKLPDEDVLQIGFDLNGGGIDADGTTDSIADDESIATAWRFPVDTNNNGKFDAYSIYGVFFRSPELDTTGKQSKERKPLEARTPPGGVLELPSNPTCKALASSMLVGDSGWYYAGGDLKKSFFVYTVNVPISNLGNLDSAKYETIKGTSGTTALEYQQDWLRKPLSNNAVVYEDDLAITPGPPLNLNGRIITNSNLFISSGDTDNNVQLYQISSPKSCFYDVENSKIFVGGNLIVGQFQGSQTKPSLVHLFQGKTTNPTTSGTNATITTSNQTVSNPTDGLTYTMYNNKALSARLDAINDERTKSSSTVKDITPDEVSEAISGSGQSPQSAWEGYFRKRIRKVPFAEVALVNGLPGLTGNPGTNTAPTTTLTEKTNSTNTKEIVTPNDWILPTASTDTAIAATTASPSSQLTVLPSQLPMTDPNTAKADKDEKENFLGDRILVGNNLPALRWYDTDKKFLGTDKSQTVGTGAMWNGSISSPARYRNTQITPLPDVGATQRDGFWERAAAETPDNPLSSVGGLRVVTGAGIYDPTPTDTFLPIPLWGSGGATTYTDPVTSNNFPLVWPDTMPMSMPGSTLKGHLKMRATAVYHYAIKPPTITKIDAKDDDGNVIVDDTTGQNVKIDNYDQEPIACVSSYYDPSDKDTARNLSTLADVSGELGGTRSNPQSNNGIVYAAPAKTDRPSSAATVTNGILSGSGNANQLKLYTQANYVFPDGRFVNPLLRKALRKAETDRNMAERSAIDAELCSLGIMDGSLTASTSTGLPDGAIEEVSMLDARQIKAIDADSSTTSIDDTFSIATSAGTTGLTGKYDLPLEQRQPMEVRLTQINLNLLRNTQVPTGQVNTTISSKIPSPEYFLPNSGIIYATRNDALPDRSDRSSAATVKASGLNEGGIDERRSDLLSPNDFLLDPSRRPNGIALIEGGLLARNDAGGDGHNDTTPSDFNALAKEKGLILVSDLPVYVQANSSNKFNGHSQQEFTDNTLSTYSDWLTKFYSRSTINPNFACRPGDPRLTTCTTGDTWRSATILADAVTLLSKNFRYGYRNEGDFDLRINTAGAFIKDSDGIIFSTVDARTVNGFFYNNFVTNGLSSGWTATDLPSTFPSGFSSASLPLIDDDYTGNTAANALNSSYFNNFVTPVQRRANFPEYVMEICRKLPVSACEETDWVIGYDNNGDGDVADTFTLGGVTVNEKDINTWQLFELDGGTADDADWVSTAAVTKLGAGTTTILPLPSETANNQTRLAARRFPRRIAYLRDKEMSGILGKDILELGPLDAAKTPTGGPAPIALGINSSGVVAQYPYRKDTLTIPRTRDNTLWYWTTQSVTGHPYQNATELAKNSMENDRYLYYYPIKAGSTWTNQFPKVGTYDFSVEKPGLSDYMYCTADNGGYKGLAVFSEPKKMATGGDANDLATTNCGNLSNVGAFVTYANGLPTDKNNPIVWDGKTNVVIDAISATPSTTDDIIDKPTADNVLTYRLPANIASDASIANGTTITMTIYGNSSQVFVLQAPNAITIGRQSNAGVGQTTFKMILKGGVRPNNIFWTVDQGITIRNAISASNPHVLIGNMMGTSGKKIVSDGGANLTIMGRIIGFQGSENLFSGCTNNNPCLPPNTKVLAATIPDQPQNIPVLQIYVPRSASSSTIAGLSVLTIPDTSNNRSPGASTTSWLPIATNSEFNLIVGSNDVPPRPFESNGGLPNLPRFLENWQFDSSSSNAQFNNQIQGSFIQLGRSKYATAPYYHVLNISSGALSTFKPTNVDSTYFNYNLFNLDNDDAGEGYYGTAISTGRTPFFGPPNRIWGYDLGLLYQVPDLFAQKFSRPPTTTKPDEYFREVGRDDAWVKALLCAKLDGDKNPTTYNTSDTNVVSDEFRPSDCSKYTGS